MGEVGPGWKRPCVPSVEFGLHPGVTGGVKQESDMIGFLFGEDGLGFLGGHGRRGHTVTRFRNTCHIASELRSV